MYVLPHEKEKTRGTVIRSKLRVTGVFFSIFFPLFSRVKELQAAKQVVEKLLPFNFFSEGEMFREMMATHAGNTTYPELPPRRVKHLLVEMYCATKKVNVEKLKLTFQPTLVKSVNPSTVKFNCKL